MAGGEAGGREWGGGGGWEERWMVAGCGMA